MPTQVHDSNGPGPTYIKTVEQLITTTTSAFAFNGKECRSERQRAWHFIERHNTQVSWRSTKFAPSQIGPLQCEAVACSVSFCRGERRVRPPFTPPPPPSSSRVSSSGRRRRLNSRVQSPRGEVLSSSVPGKRTPVLPSSSSAPETRAWLEVVVASSLAPRPSRVRAAVTGKSGLPGTKRREKLADVTVKRRASKNVGKQ